MNRRDFLAMLASAPIAALEQQSPATLGRIGVAVGLFLCGLVLGLSDFDRHGRLVATALNWFGFLVGSSGLLLLIL